ncbi:DEAD/DEAH box helicase family protein [Peribacillus frigoritolerans]|uniref:DEAD/DEAH box helicase family protein n=1 Tax=Peribacillus frigoritolerans TaxID=450367 RepID=UPI0034E07A2D
MKNLIIDANFLENCNLRYYQINILNSIKNEIQTEKRYLCEMATGTGKMTVALGAIKLFLDSKSVHKVLVLFDRTETLYQFQHSCSEILTNYKLVSLIKNLVLHLLLSPPFKN